MGIGFLEALIVLHILLLAIAFGLTRLSRVIWQWKRTDQSQASSASSETQAHPQRQINEYKPHGWMDEELAHQRRDKKAN
ncbi:MAG: hypothetical protein MOB07_13340 [Acidobacteria bacterium]|nr:hypothetical protein [Acidobacteriota bacterium]